MLEDMTENRREDVVNFAPGPAAIATEVRWPGPVGVQALGFSTGAG